ncbi:glycosyltransferase [Curvivirga aplysinae]|uniref:glycosyltransferase n=1 Tax=Curvivirga aplysinae TaxID=2529852 RepID=UPI0012BC4791|nr:glycosyltransferase [Curvivirga aplysinae]MTI11403.1 glycosyltransferase family 1 protein [Curvivirga aplysinae]
MNIFINRKAVSGPWGGENSFMGALCKDLKNNGHTIVTTLDNKIDIALINALTLIDINTVKTLHSRNIPIIHRKVGFIVSGSEEIRAVHNGVVEGDRRQIEFSPYIRHSVFQSQYSYDFFTREGFEGPHSIIHNGVDEKKFNLNNRSLFGLKEEPRRFWDGKEPFKILIVSWSNDKNKGFHYYEEIDKQLAGREDVKFTFAGRRPEGLEFKNIKTYPPQNHKKLANLYRSHHALLFLGREETCSNTILEGINCGLPIIFHNSGASPETAGPYGTVFGNDIFSCIETIQRNYLDIVKNIPNNPYKISQVAPKYRKIIDDVYREWREEHS